MRRSAGFTLVEMLVALAILALLSVMLFGGMRYGRRVWQIGDRDAEQAAHLDSVENFLRQAISRARPLALPPNLTRLRPFVGEAHSMTFVAPLFEGQAAGLYSVTLTDEQTRQGPALVMSWQEPEGSPARTRIVDRVAAEFAYFGSAAEGWQPSWQEDYLPWLVSIRFAGRWPDMVVQLMSAPPAMRADR